ncbi:MAG TPA: hypothetical protein VNF29_08800 [Candidatus Binataceae bacterium]|nr:hypothetical protein [Candidatus Binataceae bacterium]
MAITLMTGRGRYALKEGAAAEHAGGATILTIVIERADGIERVAFKCAIADELAPGAASGELLARLAPWLEREFEMTRELALKTIRSEHRMLELAFGESNRGPF